MCSIAVYLQRKHDLNRLDLNQPDEYHCTVRATT